MNGQSISPLQQVMATSSLITSPQVFRDMQSEILKKERGTSPGLHMDDFYKEMSDARTRLIQIIHRTKNEVNITKDSARCSLMSIVFNISLKEKKQEKEIILSAKEILDRIKLQAAKKFGTYLNNEAEHLFPKTEKDALIATLFQVLNSSGVSKIRYSGTTQEDYINGIALILVDYIFDYTMTYLQNLDNPVDLTTIVEDKIKEIMEKVSEAFDQSVDKLEQSILKALDNVEYAVNDAISQASDFLVRGNTGIGISKGNGTFGGGIYLAYTTPSLQIGLYGNNQFGGGDTNKTTSESLIGIRLMGALDKVQVDLLISYLQGSPNGSESEYGFGISYRVSNSLVVGGVLFKQAKDEGIMSYGITLTPVEFNAPTVFLGVTKKDGTFIMQTSFPINPSN